jgi:NDP-sugar pyrophosphorylase family protein
MSESVARLAEDGRTRPNNGVPPTPRAVILAGGRGTRLAPYTSILPKPLMPIGERAILEVVVDQLERHGITDITFSVGYLSHLIRAVFDTRPNGHVTIRYVQESRARGTAGPLRLVDDLDETFLVMNGDVLTDLDFTALVRHHRDHDNALTIATRERAIQIDYGVLQLDDTMSLIHGYAEKPVVTSVVSMGIYVLEPWVLEYVPPRRRFDFPDLVLRLLDAGHPVGAYRHDGVWFDIGRREDYECAVAAWGERNGRELASGSSTGVHTPPSDDHPTAGRRTSRSLVQPLPRPARASVSKPPVAVGQVGQ